MRSPSNSGSHHDCSADERADGVAQLPHETLNASSAPVYPEALEKAHARYAAALQRIADRHHPGSVLVITHGEAVRQSVTRIVRGCPPSAHSGCLHRCPCITTRGMWLAAQQLHWSVAHAVWMKALDSDIREAYYWEELTGF